jgi:hypothetical protein
VTEDEARAAPAGFDGLGGLEAWIAEQPWEAAPGGWTVLGKLQGWTFQVAPGPGAVRITASMGEGAPAVWTVPGRPARA